MKKYICEGRIGGKLIQREVWAHDRSEARQKCIDMHGFSPNTIEEAL